jgi:sulfite reductase alpha subunit-like flavoprotein
MPKPEVEAPLTSAQDASRMAPDVAKAFVSLYRDNAGVSEQDVEVWMEGLKDSRHYLVDVWPQNS